MNHRTGHEPTEHTNIHIAYFVTLFRVYGCDDEKSACDLSEAMYEARDPLLKSKI